MLKGTIMFSLIRKNFRCLLPWSRSYPRWDADPCVSLAARFMRDRSGAYLVMLGLMAPFFIGALAVGSETGMWYATQAKMQDAAIPARSAPLSASLLAIRIIRSKLTPRLHPMASSTAQAARWLP